MKMKIILFLHTGYLGIPLATNVAREEILLDTAAINEW